MSCVTGCPVIITGILPFSLLLSHFMAAWLLGFCVCGVWGGGSRMWNGGMLSKWKQSGIIIQVLLCLL